jgi:glycosyltransferase involved in cell wall biosynthesis
LDNLQKHQSKVKEVKPTLVISEWAPPQVGGGPTIMRSLLKHFPKGSYAILSGSLFRSNVHLDLDSRLDCKYYIADLPPFLLSRRNRRYLAPFLEALVILWVTMKGLYIVKRNGIENIFATTYGGFEVAAFIIHKILRKRLYIYLFDIYEESQLSRWGQLKARVMEPRLMHASKKVFVMSEFLKDHIQKKYGVEPIFMPHALDSSFKYNDIGKSPVAQNKPFTVVYTGMVYEAQIEGILNMVKVVNSMQEGDVIFKVYSPQSRESLERRGIKGRNVFCGFVNAKDIPSVQQEADALLISYSFNSPYPLVIKTASPGKIAEYLAACRPIIVNAPEDSYISYYAKTKGFGIVVDKNDEHELKKAILQLMNDTGFYRQLVKNANRAVREHDGKTLSERLQTYLV